MRVSEIQLTAYGRNLEKIHAAVLAAAASVPVIAVMNCQSALTDDVLTLVRYDKNPTAPNFSYDPARGAQWTNVVTDSHDIAGNVCGFNAGENWVSILVIRLGFPAGTEILGPSANVLQPPYVKQDWPHVGQEFWVGIDIPSNSIGLVSVKSDSAGAFYI